MSADMIGRFKPVSSSAVKRACDAVWLIALCAGLMPTLAHGQQYVALTEARVETVSKQGVLESATILIKDGKITAIGADVDVPVAAKVINLRGNTVMPGIVDPYYVVSIGRNVQATPPRTIVFGGRVFVIGGGRNPIATTFARVVDGFDTSREDWRPALRSGMTSLHLATGGFAQSAMGQLEAQEDIGKASIGVQLTKPEGQLLVAVSNETKALNVLRAGLKDPDAKTETSSGSSSRPTREQMLAALRARMGSRGGQPSATQTAKPADKKVDNPIEKMWSEVREGKRPVFINVNNASAVLHVASVLEGAEKAKAVLIASGQDVFKTLESLNGKQTSVVLPPRIELKPNSRIRINVPKILMEEKIPFAFSLSLGQSDYRAMQHNPLFAVGMLVRGGLDRAKALEALTIGPAKMLGIEKEVGSVEVGKTANLVVFDGDPLAAMTSVKHVFVAGKSVQER